MYNLYSAAISGLKEFCLCTERVSERREEKGGKGREEYNLITLIILIGKMLTSQSRCG